MAKFETGQQHITERDIAISVHKINGITLNQVIEYPKGEVFEIINVTGTKKSPSYEVEFWQDADVEINGKKIIQTFDEETLSTFLMTSEEFERQVI